ncbi:MAG: hypothetical protein GKR99_10645 [Rhodobacteraceae bacterium]|nr:hypothetical protein [Paracoccaceae bacterium]
MTKFRIGAFGAAMVCATGLAALPVAAQDKSGTNVAPIGEAEAGAVSQLAMAQDLYAYGVANGDAIAVLSAARITKDVDITDADRSATSAADETRDTTEDGTGVDAPADAEMMLAKAAELAGENDMIAGLVQDAMDEGSRGRIGGASRTLSRLPAGYNDDWEIPFFGGRFAEISIIGDGDADLDVIVSDENGNTICLDVSYSDRFYCAFNPLWDGYFYVRVSNMGRLRNSYYLLTN